MYIAEEDTMSGGHTAVRYKGRPSLAWWDVGKGLVVASFDEAAVSTETLIPYYCEGSTPGSFWFLDVGGEGKLVVEYYRPEKAESQEELLSFGRERKWLFCYDLAEGQPQVSGKVCIEEGEARAGTVVCGSSDDRIVVWQIDCSRQSPPPRCPSRPFGVQNGGKQANWTGRQGTWAMSRCAWFWTRRMRLPVWWKNGRIPKMPRGCYVLFVATYRTLSRLAPIAVWDQPDWFGLIASGCGALRPETLKA